MRGRLWRPTDWSLDTKRIVRGYEEAIYGAECIRPSADMLIMVLEIHTVGENPKCEVEDENRTKGEITAVPVRPQRGWNYRGAIENESR